jgi:hypothetical protein
VFSRPQQIAKYLADSGRFAALRAEHQLVVSCARTSLEGVERERVREIVRQDMDWEYLLQYAAQQKVLPLLIANLQQHCQDCISARYQERLRWLYTANAARNLRLAGYLLQLSRRLERDRIRAIPYKGPTLAYQAYGNIGYRQIGDLDILVHPRDYERCRLSLLDHGFEKIADYSWECTLRDKGCGIHLDVHRSLTPDQFAVRLDFGSIYRRLDAQQVGDGWVQLPCPEDMLIVLSIQLAKDAWGHDYKSVQLGKLCDLAELLRRHPTMDWVQVRRDAGRFGYQGMLAVGVGLAHRILGAPLPPVEFSAPRSADIAILVNDVSTKILKQRVGTQETHLSREQFHSKIRERWWDRLQPYYLDYRKRLRPNRRDYDFIRLPDEIASLYWLIRPVRLLRDYAAHGISATRAAFLRWRRRS